MRAPELRVRVPLVTLIQIVPTTALVPVLWVIVLLAYKVTFPPLTMSAPLTMALYAKLSVVVPVGAVEELSVSVLMVCELVALTVTAPVMVTSSAEVGNAFPLQFKGSFQLLPFPPPSQVTTAACACGANTKKNANARDTSAKFFLLKELSYVLILKYEDVIKSIRNRIL
jgi:hypothetical protein